MKQEKTSFLYRIGKHIANVFFPKVCLSCKKDISCLSKEPLCLDCLSGLEYLQKPYCERCGMPLEFSRGYCYDCDESEHALAYARSALIYNKTLQPLLHAFKYSSREDLAPFLANEMAKAYDYFPEIKDHDFLMPVPLHKKRFHVRGYNQAELLASELAKLKGFSVITGAAERAVATPTQTKLNKEERHKNVHGAFKVTRPELVKGKKILLIDDVATTLSTLDELASTLKAAGAESVCAYTLAREPIQ
ncbi:MAG: ComF family protein [Elusimicrobiales bacterium]|nr:ComF family protein [Elusimicrobiales bacterium]